MRNLRDAGFLLAIVFILCGSTADAGFISPPTYDQGNISSDGSGWQALIRPLEPGEVVSLNMSLGPPFPGNPSYVPPTTPAQGSVVLTAGEPLVLVLPHGGGSPGWDSVATTGMVGNEINVYVLGSAPSQTDAYWGPSEYLHPLGSLAPGSYRLNLTTEQPPVPGLEPFGAMVAKGHILFRVVAVPEPASALVLFSVLVLLFAASGRDRILSVKFQAAAS